MKKIPLLLLILLHFSSFAQIPKELHFKVQYLPHHTYNQTMLQNSVTELTYKANKEFLQHLERRGIANPTIKLSQSNVKSVSTTGSEVMGNYPVTIEIIKADMNSGAKLPEGTKFFGKVPVGDFKPLLDSIYSPDLDNDIRKKLLSTMQSLLSQISFSEKTLKVGEKFSREMPITIPIGDSNYNMSIITTYKLVRILNDSANFDIKQVYKMESSIDGKKIKVTGEGKGKITYDIKNNFYTLYHIDINMKSQFSFDKVKLEVKVISSSTQLIDIKGN